MGEVIPLYQRLVKDNRIELSVTPYYHPILPLLCDTDIARRAERETVDASFVFKHPEDADIQVRRAVAYFERLFGFKPDGMWPSEGSVSEEAAALIATFGFSWIATDQEILEHSEVDGGEKNILLPHRCPGANSHLHIVFRDHALSDAIGFSYAEMDPEKAAADFMNRAESVRQRILEKNQDPDRFLLNVILDGENCWEFYPDNGEHFLRALYRRLSESRTLRSVTVGEFIQTCAERSRELPRITRLHAGSWINHNFGIWIGTHKEKNTAWQYLKRTRDFLVERSENFQDSKKLQNAWEEIYIAEGSDWFWWFGDDHQADNKIEFDALFRYHLIRVYDILEVTPPSYLMAPIMSPKSSGVFARVPTAPIKPKIDGRVTHFYEWADAGLYEAHLDGDTMHLSERWIKNIYYGYDEESLYFRIDFFEKAGKKFKNDLAYSLRFDFTEPVEASLQFTSQGSLKADTAGSKSRFDALMEVQIPFQTLSMSAFQSVELTVAVFERSREIVRRPSRRSLVVSIPDESSDKYFWSV
jgi:alpha-amylase/alpha-mannosidase (GH57 family)